MKQPEQTLYGLVLTGGRSTRMKQDKAALQFHNRPQAGHCFDLLSTFCQKVFVSNRKEQAEEAAQRDYPQIHDIEPFVECGPVGGILSALHTNPDVAWLVIACDLPFVDNKVIDYLISNRSPQKLATAYVSAHNGLPEPLCTIYEPAAAQELLAFFRQGLRCPRKFLINTNICLIEQPSEQALTNVNHPEEFNSVKQSI